MQASPCLGTYAYLLYDIASDTVFCHVSYQLAPAHRCRWFRSQGSSAPSDSRQF